MHNPVISCCHNLPGREQLCLAVLHSWPCVCVCFLQNSYVGGGSVFPYIYPCRFIACYVYVANCLVRGDESLLNITQLRLSIIRLLLAIIFLILTTAAFTQIIVIKSSEVSYQWCSLEHSACILAFEDISASRCQCASCLALLVYAVHLSCLFAASDLIYNLKTQSVIKP